jgi:hypothetical protein
MMSLALIYHSIEYYLSKQPSRTGLITVLADYWMTATGWLAEYHR